MVAQLFPPVRSFSQTWNERKHDHYKTDARAATKMRAIYTQRRGQKEVLYSSHIWVQSVDGSTPRQFTNFPKGYVYEYAFSRDGMKLYVARGYLIRDAVMIKNF